jgi:septal ring factor EnvC (AmiA/AmiB activator)
MTQLTDTDIRDLKDLIVGFRDEVKDELAHIRTDIKVMDTRLIEVEKKVDKLDGKIDKQDNRLWAFGGLILAAALGTIYKLLAFPSN